MSTISHTTAAILAHTSVHVSTVVSDAVALLPTAGSGWAGYVVQLDTAALRDIYRALVDYYGPTSLVLEDARTWAGFIGASRSLRREDLNGRTDGVSHVAGLIYAITADLRKADD